MTRAPRQWIRWMDRSDVLIVDTETTGLDGQAEAIEVALVDTTGALRLHAFSMPVGPITSGAARIHGLSRGVLADKGARTWPEVHADLVDALSDATLVLGWNVSFDYRLLRQTAQRHRKRIPHPSARHWHDLIPAYRRIRPGGRHALSNALQREGITVAQQHRAVDDCIAVLWVMQAVIDQ